VGDAGRSMWGKTTGHDQDVFRLFTDTKVVVEGWL
jgi:hypothetical protein